MAMPEWVEFCRDGAGAEKGPIVWCPSDDETGADELVMMMAGCRVGSNGAHRQLWR